MGKNIFEEMEYRVNRNTKYHYNIAIQLYEEHEELKEQWDWCPNEHLIKNRFVKKSVIDISIDRLEKDNNNLYFDRDTVNGTNSAYLVSNTLFDPFTREEFYLIKVGKGIDLYQRLHSYNTYNPMLWTIDYTTFRTPKEMTIYENLCHTYLNQISGEKVKRAKEWYRVDRKTYLTICDLGFKFFGNTEELRKKIFNNL